MGPDLGRVPIRVRFSLVEDALFQKAWFDLKKDGFSPQEEFMPVYGVGDGTGLGVRAGSTGSEGCLGLSGSTGSDGCLGSSGSPGGVGESIGEIVGIGVGVPASSGVPVGDTVGTISGDSVGCGIPDA